MVVAITENITKLLLLLPFLCAPGSNTPLSTWNQMSLLSRENLDYDSELGRRFFLHRSLVNQFAASSLCDRLRCWLMCVGFFFGLFGFLKFYFKINFNILTQFLSSWYDPSFKRKTFPPCRK